jgi:hypothetical protein
MRDIRKDLEERLIGITSERESLQNRLAHLAKAETMLRTLLEEEELRWRSQQRPLPGLEIAQPRSGARTLLGRFILDTMSDGGEWRVPELATLAKNKGLIANGKSPKRVLHFSLVGMRNNGLVEMVTSGVWKISQRSESGED